MDERWEKLRRLFDEALAMPGDRRAAFLERECGDDISLLAELRAMLDADERGTRGLRRSVGDAAAAALESANDGLLNERIGNYRLVEILGTGGMGNVYLGRRVDEQFEHEVAIKILQPGRTSPHFVERFRAERQVLAGLDHPHIARLLDGGETPSGLQYLIMEYIRGRPIDVYCDERRLDLRQRLRLFQAVCLAVDYAHRQLVVHRDVKPSNILVTDEGAPKLLDFGVAKVIDAVGARGVVTLDSQRMLTPEFASPEQVRGEAVSTATDVYSLGVLLYRLLCGRGPYRARSDLPSGLVRAILEDLPSKPSAAVTQATDAAIDDDSEDVGTRRGSTVARLQRRLRGDLDTIALTALRKEPERRYSSARALYDDIQNYLSDRPINARPDSLGYLATKFVRRNRVIVAATAAVLVAIVVSVLQIVDERDRAEAQAATAERVSAFLVSMLESSNPYERSPDVTARALLDRGAVQIDAELSDEPLVAARLKVTMAKAYSSLGLQKTAAELAESSLAEFSVLPGAEPDLAGAYATLADIEYERQDYHRARTMAETALEVYEKSRPRSFARIATTKVALSRALMRLDETDAMLTAAAEAVDDLRALYGDDHPQTNAAVANLSQIYNEMGDYARAAPLAEQVVAWIERTYGEEDILLARPLHNVGQIRWNLGDFRGANTVYERELAILEKVLGRDHPSLHPVLVALASNQRKLGYPTDAKAYYERSIFVLENSESPPLGKLADSYGALGTLIMDNGYLDEAEPLLRRALELATEVYGEGNADNTFRLMHLGVLHRKREEFDTARRYMQAAIDAARSRYPETHRNVQIMRLQLGITEGNAGRYAEARDILEDVLSSLLANQGPDHPLVGQTLLELAEVHIKEGDYARAEQRLVRSLEIYRALRDEWHPDIELALRLRATVAEGLGDADKAAEYLREADAILEGRQKVSAEEAEEAGQSEF